jgi:hypothetical protein
MKLVVVITGETTPNCSDEYRDAFENAQKAIKLLRQLGTFSGSIESDSPVSPLKIVL